MSNIKIASFSVQKEVDENKKLTIFLVININIEYIYHFRYLKKYQN